MYVYLVTEDEGDGGKVYASRDSFMAAYADWFEEEPSERQRFTDALDAADAGGIGDLGDGDIVTRQVVN